MEAYVAEMLDRIRPLIDEYGTASESCRNAHAEYRSVSQSFRQLEDERVCLETTIRLWAQNPGVRFDEKDKLEAAAVTLKQLRGRLPWSE